jgi:hypothetical protein
MIARVWKGCANSENVRDYVDHFERSVFPELSQINGYRASRFCGEIWTTGSS